MQAERHSERTQVAIWSLSPQAPPICQAPTLLLGPLLASSHPPPSSALSPPLPFLLPCKAPCFLPTLSQSAPSPPPFSAHSFLPQVFIPTELLIVFSPSQGPPEAQACPVPYVRWPSHSCTLHPPAANRPLPLIAHADGFETFALSFPKPAISRTWQLHPFLLTFRFPVVIICLVSVPHH